MWLASLWAVLVIYSALFECCHKQLIWPCDCEIFVKIIRPNRAAGKQKKKRTKQKNYITKHKTYLLRHNKHCINVFFRFLIKDYYHFISEKPIKSEYNFIAKYLYWNLHRNSCARKREETVSELLKIFCILCWSLKWISSLQTMSSFRNMVVGFFK